MNVRHCRMAVFFMVTWGLMAMSLLCRGTSIGEISQVLSLVLVLSAMFFCLLWRAQRVVMGLLLGGTLLGQIVIMPATITFRTASPMTKALGAGECIRLALANFATDDARNAFPAPDRIRDYATLSALVNEYGGVLRAEENAAVRFVSYEVHNTNVEGRPEPHYVLILAVPHAHNQPFPKIRVTPAGVEKLSGADRPQGS
jgi:hypothetical protein